MKQILTFLSAIFLSSCLQEKADEKKYIASDTVISVLDTIVTKVEPEEPISQKTLFEKFEKKDFYSFKSAKFMPYDLDKNDSLFVDEIFSNALSKLKKSKLERGYSKIDDFGEVTWGNLFDSNKKHSIIRMSFQNTHFVKIYELGKKTKNILSINESEMEFISDTIKDINRDNFNDFVSVTYSSSGCCARANSSIWLYSPTDNTFIEGLNLLNIGETFDDKTSIGMTYGHPGEADLYKVKWNRKTYDYLEFLSKIPLKKLYVRERKRMNKIIIDTLNLNQVPREYRKYHRFDWFNDEI